jgi:predicted RNase H-like HicB family nuclease
MLKYKLIIYWSEIDQAYIVEIPELKGLMADGATYQEAVTNAEQVISEWLESAKELGRVIPEPKKQMNLKSCIEWLEFTVSKREKELIKLQSCPSNHHSLITLVLAGQAIELGHSIVSLAKSNSDSGLPILLRSLLECRIQMEFLYKDPIKNALSIELNNNMEHLKFLKESLNSDKIALFKDINTQLIASGAEEKNFYNMLDFVEAKESWYPFFRVLSGFTHGKLTALSTQFLTGMAEQTKFELFKGVDEEHRFGFLSASKQFIDGTVLRAIELLDI